MMPAQRPGQSRQDYETPQEFLDAVVARFGALTADLAATRLNAVVCEYLTPDDDALSVAWSSRFPEGNLWLNPPFGNIEPWAQKCSEETPLRKGLIFLLTPASVGSEWFARHIERKALVLALRPRISFDGKHPFPKDCILSVFGRSIPRDGRRVKSGFETWRWK